MYSFSKKEFWVLSGLLVLLVPAMLVNLGIVPLYVEEPRRATVALEMLLRGNWLVPTINGEIYQLKPPVFNWILASIYYVSGNITEFLTRITSVVSILLLGFLIFLTGKKYVTKSFGALSAFLFVTASGNLFFNALLAEIDLFYSLVTYSGLVSLFHFYQRRNFFALFLVVYFLGAVGTLTKGLPSLLFTGLSITAFFLVSREYKKLFSWQHLAGIILYLALVGAYFLAYSRHEDAISYLMKLSFESGKRFSGDTFWDYLHHMALYPLDTLMNLLPASVLILFALRRSFLRDIRTNPFLKFALLMLIVHFPVYWLPPGGRQRYIIMLYPFIIQILTYFYLIYFRQENKITRIFNIIITFTLALGTLACLAPVFIGIFDFIEHLQAICIMLFVLMLINLILQIKYPRFTMFSLLFALIALRFVFGFAVLPVRATEGRAPENMQAALDIAKMGAGKQVCILHPTYFPMQSVFYFEKERMEILPLCTELEPGKLFIVEDFILKDYSVYREDEINGPKSHFRFPLPFSKDHHPVLQGFAFGSLLAFQLQNIDYHLLMPFHQHP